MLENLYHGGGLCMGKERKALVHPGEVLQKAFMEPRGLSQNRLAIALNVPPRRINEIVLRKRKITPDTALRLARYFNNEPRFWLKLQMGYDLELAEKKAGEKIRKKVSSGS